MIPTTPLCTRRISNQDPISSIMNFDKLKEIVFNVLVQKWNLSCRSQGNKENEKKTKGFKLEK